MKAVEQETAMADMLRSLLEHNYRKSNLYSDETKVGNQDENQTN